MYMLFHHLQCLQVYTALWENWQHTRVVAEQDKDSGIYWYTKLTDK